MAGLLILAVAVPTACVLWFMFQAMRNERLAVRERLTDAYGGRLATAQSALDTHWEARSALLATAAAADNAAAAFAQLVRGGVADSVIIFDRAGRPRYPAATLPPASAPAVEAGGWSEAERVEHQDNDPAAAADLYGSIAAQAADSSETARALQAQVRCLLKTGQKDSALRILQDELMHEQYRSATDAQGRLIVPGAMLLVLELVGDDETRSVEGILQRLVNDLEDYDFGRFPSGQRRFLMQQVQALGLPFVRAPFSTLEAEALADQYLESNALAPLAGHVTRTSIPDLWQFATGDLSVTALFRGAHLATRMDSIIAESAASPGTTVVVVPPTAASPSEEPFIISPAGRHLPGWQLALHLQGDNPFADAAHRRMIVYAATGAAGFLVMIALALLVARQVGRQIRLTRLKNDLIATVSHELKTPLTSIRLLADTLLAHPDTDAERAREYLQLISKENIRLSRLVDNFLTFSRMERNKHAFEFGKVIPGELVDAAVNAVRDRFDAAGCRLDVEVAPALPAVSADFDAMVTVLLNLLDNAFKYGKDDRHILLRACEADGCVRFEVEDNGVGIPRRSLKRIFDRFYQVDQSLSREAGGCGLGLSIVQFIVDAHGGSIGVTSEPGRGSLFSVNLPIAAEGR